MACLTREGPASKHGTQYLKAHPVFEALDDRCGGPQHAALGAVHPHQGGLPVQRAAWGEVLGSTQLTAGHGYIC
jgi:hypothetical protein